MEYAQLGRTDREVSRLGFGGATAGLRNYLADYDPDRTADREALFAAIHRAVALGVTYFDTAPGYGSGAGERLFGEGLAEADRDRIFVATKCGVTDADGVRRSVEASLANLGLDRLDLLQVHGGSYGLDQIEAILRPGGMLYGMLRLQGDGLVDHLGFTSEAVDEGFYVLLNGDEWDVVQVAYNFCFQHPYDPSRKWGALYDMAARRLGVVTMRTLTSGLFQRWMRLVRPDDAYDYSAALLQFQLSNPLVDVALVGMRTVAEVEANVAVVDDSAGRINLTALHERYVDA